MYLPCVTMNYSLFWFKNMFVTLLLCWLFYFWLFSSSFSIDQNHHGSQRRRGRLLDHVKLYTWQEKRKHGNLFFLSYFDEYAQFTICIASHCFFCIGRLTQKIWSSNDPISKEQNWLENWINEIQWLHVFLFI